MMTFKTLAALLATNQSIAEDVDHLGGGIGPNSHPVLSRAELVRFSDKLDQARNKLEEIRSIFKEAPGATGPAHKLHHIGSKGGFDMGAFDDVTKKIDALEDSMDELHQAWGTQVQSDTGAFDDETPPADDEDLPPADDEDLPPADEDDAAVPAK